MDLFPQYSTITGENKPLSSSTDYSVTNDSALFKKQVTSPCKCLVLSSKHTACIWLVSNNNYLLKDRVFNRYPHKYYLHVSSLCLNGEAVLCHSSVTRQDVSPLPGFYRLSSLCCSAVWHCTSDPLLILSPANILSSQCWYTHPI